MAIDKCIKCGSYAFNLYKEDIDQGGLCDVHYWQYRAHRAEALAEQPAPAPGYCNNCKDYTIDAPLAEQPAQDDPDLQDKDPELVEQPAQHEPFTHYRHYDNGLQDWADEKTIPLYTSPPAQRTWVGLTYEEAKEIYTCIHGYDSSKRIAEAIEAKLKEKNT